MKLGVTFPQTEIGADPAAIRDYVQAAEALGYDHVLAFDHVLGANPASRPGWSGYRHADMFHEPFVLFGYVAGVTRTLKLVTGIIILPQRQAALVAKQAAEVDVLSGGRLRLGVGIGWNPVEYEALGQSFSNRGRRCEEQVEVLRALWTRDLVTFQGRWHTVTDAGLNPLPVQRPIPIWFGGVVPRAVRRAARLGDGWFPMSDPSVETAAGVERFRDYVRDAGRDPATVGIEGQVSLARRPEGQWAADLAAWRRMGATHLAVNTMGAGLATPAAHIEAIRRFKAVADG